MYSSLTDISLELVSQTYKKGNYDKESSMPWNLDDKVAETSL